MASQAFPSCREGRMTSLQHCPPPPSRSLYLSTEVGTNQPYSHSTGTHLRLVLGKLAPLLLVIWLEIEGKKKA